MAQRVAEQGPVNGSLMKVLLINPPNSPFTAKELLIEPIDVLTVASYVKMLGADVTLHDMDHLADRGELLASSLREIEPDIVVIPFDYHIPLYTTDAADALVEVLFIVRQHCQKIVLGGRPAQTFPAKFLIDESIVIIKGEMELALKELIALKDWDATSISTVKGVIFKQNGAITRSEERKELIDLNALPIPDRSLVEINDYIDVHSILSSRGCVEKCSFCPVHGFWGRWRKRNPELVVDEIQYLVKNFAATKVLFLDDHATADKRRMQQICEEILRRKISVTLGCLGTATSVDKKTLDLMFQAGFRWIHFGAESGSDRILALLQKRLTVAKLSEGVTLAKEAGLRVRTSWIMDPPDITPEELEQTLNLITQTDSHEVRIHFLAMRACAPLASSFNGMPGAELPPQYLHSDSPRVESSAISSIRLKSEVDKAILRLRQSGYLLISKPDDWGLLSESSLRDRKTKFISLCPGKYGVGWEI